MAGSRGGKGPGFRSPLMLMVAFARWPDTLREGLTSFARTTEAAVPTLVVVASHRLRRWYHLMGMAPDNISEIKTSGGETEVICPNCSETFSTFLQNMAEHNLTVTCPHCGQVHPRPHRP